MVCTGRPKNSMKKQASHHYNYQSVSSVEAAAPMHVLQRRPGLGLILIVFMSVVISYCNIMEGAEGTLQLSVYTPADGGYPENSSWISLLASALLGQGTPGLFWGAVPADAVESTCQMIEGGYLTIPATVSAYGMTRDWNLQIQATGGCDASSNSPVGVEIVFIDDTGVTNVIICDENAWTVGCGLYNTGDDVNSLYREGTSTNTLTSDPSMTVTSSSTTSTTTEVDVSNFTAEYGPLTLASSNKGRRLMDDSSTCVVEGALAGSIFGFAGVFGCVAVDPLLFPFCAKVTVAVSTILGVAERCATKTIGSCVKGTSMVITEVGDRKKICDIGIGEKVAVWNTNLGKLEFSDVYGFGHADANASSMFLQIELFQNHGPFGAQLKKIELTPLHFVLIHSGNDQIFYYKYAKDIVLGDKMLAWDENINQMISHSVIDIRSTIAKGLFNPFTLEGTIVVDDVVISIHSEWFLDNLFATLKITHWLPSTYQTLLVIPLLLYQILEKDAYSRLYHFLDASICISMFGSNYGGGIFLIAFFLITLGTCNIINISIFASLQKENRYS